METSFGYVIAAYVVTAVTLGGYAWRLFSRAKTARRRADAGACRRP
jgi:CcmD family protein